MAVGVGVRERVAVGVAVLVRVAVAVLVGVAVAVGELVGVAVNVDVLVGVLVGVAVGGGVGELVGVGVSVGVFVGVGVGEGVGVTALPVRLTFLPSMVRVPACGVVFTGANDTATVHELFGRTILQPVTAENGGLLELVITGSARVTVLLLLMTERFWLAISPTTMVPKSIPKVLKVCLKFSNV